MQESSQDFVTKKVPLREKTQKVYMQVLWFLCSARHLILVDIHMKFREESLKRA